jgi:hypothetical protein
MLTATLLSGVLAVIVLDDVMIAGLILLLGAILSEQLGMDFASAAQAEGFARYAWDSMDEEMQQKFYEKVYQGYVMIDGGWSYIGTPESYWDVVNWFKWLFTGKEAGISQDDEAAIVQYWNEYVYGSRYDPLWRDDLGRYETEEEWLARMQGELLTNIPTPPALKVAGLMFDGGIECLDFTAETTGLAFPKNAEALDAYIRERYVYAGADPTAPWFIQLPHNGDSSSFPTRYIIEQPIILDGNEIMTAGTWMYVGSSDSYHYMGFDVGSGFERDKALNVGSSYVYVRGIYRNWTHLSYDFWEGRELQDGTMGSANRWNQFMGVGFIGQSNNQLHFVGYVYELDWLTMALTGKLYFHDEYYDDVHAATGAAERLGYDGGAVIDPTIPVYAVNPGNTLTPPRSWDELANGRPGDFSLPGITDPTILANCLAELTAQIDAISGILGGNPAEDAREAMEKMKEYLEWIRQRLRDGAGTADLYRRLWEILQRLRQARTEIPLDHKKALEQEQDGIRTIAEELGLAKEGTQTDAKEEEIKWSRLSEGWSGLGTVFPFCIPFDLINIFSSFQAEPQKLEPVKVNIAPFLPNDAGVMTLDFNMKEFDLVFKIIRTGILLLFVVGLARATSSLIKW